MTPFKPTSQEIQSAGLKETAELRRGHHTDSLTLLVILLVVLVGALSYLPGPVRASTASIWTDKADYSPEQTVLIYGSGFLPSSTLNLSVTRPDLTVNSWTNTSDANGNFTATYLLDGITGNYTVAATDGTNTATTTFTDSPTLVILGSDGSKHDTSSKEENLGQIAYTTLLDKFLTVEANGLGGGKSISWSVSYVSGYGNDATLSLLTTFTPSSGTLTGTGTQSVELKITTSTLTPGTTYHGQLTATGSGSNCSPSCTAGFYYFQFTVLRSTSTSVSCTPNPDPVNVPTSCTATVTDTSSGAPTTATGTVTFTSSGSGSFSSTTCTLSSGGCSVSYTPNSGSEGSPIITGTYGGDSLHLGSSGTFTLTVSKRATSTTISCTSSAPVNAPTTCTATVSDTSSGTAITPGGTVTFSSMGSGSFSSPSCTLSAGSCSVTYTPSPGSEGTHSISGSYGGDTDHSTSSGSFSLSVSKRSSSASVSCSSPDPVNAPTTCTATASDSSAGTLITPSGTITFSSSGSGSFSSSTCTLVSGSCSVTYTPSLGSEGAPSITGSYGGDNDHSTSSGSFSLSVAKRSTSTSVVCAPSSDPVNAATTCTAIVSDTSPGTAVTPTGSVTFTSAKSGSFSPSTCTLAAGSCSVTFTPSPGTLGTHTISASYGGDSDHSASSGTFVLSAIKRSTSTSVSCSSPDPVNAPTTCSATVSDISSGTTITPTGTATFSSSGSGTFSFSACTLSGAGASASCSVTYTPNAGSEGTHTITGSYSGDSNDNTSSGSFSLSVTQRSTSTSINCVPSSVPTSSASTCTATVSDTSLGTIITPSGTITFTTSAPGTFSSNTCTLISGNCSVTFTPSPGSEGTQTITGSYGADTDHSTSSGTFSLTVNQRTTSTSTSCSPNPVVVNQGISCNATVSDTSSGTSITPAGTVSFTYDGSPAGSCTLISGSCSVTITPASSSAGSHTIAASYVGDTDHTGSSGSTALTVNKRSTSTSVNCSPNPVAVNQATTCTATVTDISPGTAITPSGSVTFSSNKPGAFGSLTCTLVSGNCSVTYTPNPGSEGTHTITGSYGGDANHLGSSNTLSLTVNQPTSVTSVVCTPNPVVVNQPTTCTATVTDTSPGTLITPTGTISWSSGGSGSFSSPTCTLIAGSCFVTYTPNPASEGSHLITGAYSGDTDHLAFSANFSLTVNQRTTSTAVSCAPASLPVNAPTTCIATVTDTSLGSPIAPTATITFSSNKPGTFSSLTCTLVVGSCSVTYTPSLGSEGTHTIAAGYGGDTDHSTSSGSFDVAATQRSTSTSVTCSPPAVAVNAPSTCTATVTDNDVGTAVTPSGTVSFGTSSAGSFTASTSCTLIAGTCSVTYTPSLGSERTHTITGTYNGNTDHSTSSGSFSLTATKRSTSTSVACAPASVPVNAPTACTATVMDTDAGTAVTPSGIVTFSSSASGSFIPATSCTLISGSCSVTYTPSPGSEGTHLITGNYSGNTDHLSSSSSFSLTASKRTTSTSVVCIPATVPVNAPTTCTATVTDNDVGTFVTPSGSVSFGSSASGSFTPSASCILSGVGPSASCSVTYTPALGSEGSHTITGTYSGDIDHFTSSGNFSLTATQRSTSTTVNCVPASVPVNAPTTCTALVSDTDVGAPVTPSGTVTFSSSKSGAFSSSTCTLVAGTCSVTYTPSPGSEGTHVITGAYGGDTDHLASSNDFSLTATRRTTSTSVVCTSNPIPVNAPTACTATVTDTDTGTPLTPTGSVSFTSSASGAFSAGSCMLSGSGASASCSVAYTPSPSSEGTHTITANYGSDADHFNSSGDFALTATKRSTITVVSCTPSPIPVNAPTICLATVTDNDVGTPLTPTGTVSFSSSASGTFLPFASCTLVGGDSSASCSVTYVPSPGSEGTHMITAGYSGDIDHFGSSNTFNLTASQRTTSTSVNCSPNPVAVNQGTLCTATVADTSPGSSIMPTGTVSWSDASGTFSSPTCALVAGSCSLTYTPNPGSEGLHIITGTYSGDTDHSTSSGSFTLTVTQRSTSTAILCTPSSVPVNAPTTCTATVTDTSPGTPITPGGTVSWISSNFGAFSSLTCVLSGGGASATCSVSYTPNLGSEGTHIITGTYLGDTDHISSGASFTVAATKRTTSTSLICSPASVPVNAPTWCTATVTDADVGTPVTPSGTVTFSSSNSGAFSSLTCTLVSGSCSVSYTPSLGSEGTHTITASYGGDTDYLTSSGSFNVTATQRSTSTSVTCSPASVPVNAPSTCTAVVSDTDIGTQVTPTGIVSWSDASGTFSSATCTLVAGTCSVTYTPSLGSEGVHAITGAYGGDTDHSLSSNSFSLTATQRSTSTAVNCVPASIPVNAPTTCTATVTDNDVGTPVTPTGTITWSDASGTFSSPTCTLFAGICSVTYTPAPGSEGTHIITGAYGGDTDHLASSKTFNLTVTQRTTSTTVNCSPNPVVVNQATTCTATVTDTSSGTPITPTGIISWSSSKTGTFSSATCMLASGSCSVSYTPSPSSEGINLITGSYGGDTDHVISSNNFSLTANKRSASTSINCSPNPDPVNAPTSCTATVTDTSPGTPVTPTGTGTVSFSSSGSGTFSPSSCTLSGGGASASCSVNYTPSPGSEGTPNITGNYGGDTDHYTSSGAFSVSVTKRSTTTAVGCSPATIPFNTSTTCTATVSDSSPGTPITPTGTVTFTSNGLGPFNPPTATCTLSATGTPGVASCYVTYTPTTIGTLTITATYGGDNDHTGSSGSASLLVPIYETSSLTDSDFNYIGSADTVFTPSCKSCTSLNLVATNPGTYYLNYVIQNPGSSSLTITLTITLPADSMKLPNGTLVDPAFILKGAMPIHIYADLARSIDVTSQATISVSSNGKIITITMTVPVQGGIRYATIHLDYRLKGTTGWASNSITTFVRSYKSNTMIQTSSWTISNNPSADILTAFVGQKLTGIGGYVLDTNANAKVGLYARLTDTSGALIPCQSGFPAPNYPIGPCDITGGDGFYFLQTPNNAAGTYKVKICTDITCGTVKAVSANQNLALNQFNLVSFTLNPADPTIYGFVLDQYGRGVAGVTVQLYDARGILLGEKITSQSGFYAFSFTQPGTYTIKIVVPSGYTCTTTTITLSLRQFDKVREDFNLTQR